MIWNLSRMVFGVFWEVLLMPCEPAGHRKIATPSVKSCDQPWRTFIRSSVVMCWTEEEYQLLWTDPVPARREMDNAASSYV
jgi:hypothetical protein